MLENYCKGNLDQIKNLIIHLNDSEYTKSLTILSGSSIGQHVRHILEFYLCLTKGIQSNAVNYDLRERDLKLETENSYAIYSIDKIRTNLLCGIENTDMKLNGNFSNNQEEVISVPTSFYRELAYCLEHSIHHQALLKIGLIELNKVQLIDENFGVAPATIRHKSKLVEA